MCSRSVWGSVLTICLLAGALVLGFSPWGLPAAQANPLNWDLQVADSPGIVGTHTSLELDGNYYPHVSYYDITNRDLKHAYWNGSGWLTNAVDSLGDVGQYTSLALDHLRARPHISYYDATNQDLKYAYQDAGGWHTQTVDDRAVMAGTTSIALNSNDYAYISYAMDGLWCANWNGMIWYRQLVDGSSTGQHNSLALDSMGRPHISYAGDAGRALRYAFWNGSAWVRQTVDGSLSVGQYNSLALDSKGYPHISYYDAAGLSLKYAFWDGAKWTIQTVDLGSVGKYTAIALDSSDHPHISYYDMANKDLKYTVWNGIRWNTQKVDWIGDVGSFSSLALDWSGNPRISYFDNATNQDLKYATGSPKPLTLQVRAKNDKPGPVDLDVYADGVFQGVLTYTADNNTWSIQSLPIPANTAKIKLVFANDIVSGPGDLDRNAYLDFLRIDGIQTEAECWDEAGNILGDPSHFSTQEQNPPYWDTSAAGLAIQMWHTGDYVEYGIGYPSANPELAASHPTVTRLGPPPFPLFRVGITARNLGNLAAGSFNIDFYLSDDPQWDASDTWFRTRPIFGLAAGANTVQRWTERFPTSASGKFVLAVIDRGNVVAEQNEKNNIVAGAQVP